MPNNYVSYDAQTPSENEKVQARQNIGAMGLNSFDLYMNGAVPRPPVPPFFTQRIPNIVPGYTEFELINGLNHALLIEQTARQNTDLLLKENLEKETADRIQADNQLQENITAEATARENADNQLQQNITAEETARINADNQLQQNITAEASARENADNQLQQNITAEASARENADNQLQQNITTEATARENADNQLQEKITAEQTARINADNQLQEKITAEQTARENADNQLQQNITTEATARENADNQLQTKINAINAQGNVRYDVVQNLTDDEKAQARANIGAGTGGTTSGAVLYDQAQSLTEEQKAQARTNIGAGTGGTAAGAVLYDQAQNLTDDQKLQARKNINALNAVIYENDFIKENVPARLLGGTFRASTSVATVGGFRIIIPDLDKYRLFLQTYDNGNTNTIFSFPYLKNNNIVLTDTLSINITGEPTFTYPLSYADKIANATGANAGYAVKRFFSGTLNITEAANVVTNCNVLEMYLLPFNTTASAGSSGSLKYKIVLEVTGVSSGSTHQVGDIITLYNKLWDNSYESVNGTVKA